MDTKVTDIRRLKKGDKLRITRDVEVYSVNPWVGTYTTKDNRTYRLDTNPDGLPGFVTTKIDETKEKTATQVSKTIGFHDLKPGDKVRIYRDVIVDQVVRRVSVGFYDTNGDWNSDFARFPNERFAYLIDSVTRPVQENPEHWPPQRGDVWRDKNGKEYYFTKITMSRDDNNDIYYLDEVKTKTPVLVYRKGNNLK